MTAGNAPEPRAQRESIGWLISVGGSRASVGLGAANKSAGSDATVGKFLGIVGSRSVVIGLITEIAQGSSADRERYHSIAQLDLIGEIKSGAGAARFQRGVTDYPAIGDSAVMMSDHELRLIYGVADSELAHIGQLQQDNTINAGVNVDDLVGKHFAILGTTGVGKSSGVAVILRQILDTRPNLRIFLVDPHNEYGRCFENRAQVFTPGNLRLPFWLFNFEETIDAFFGGRPGVDEEIEILAEVIPLAKAAYLQYRGGGTAADSRIVKKKDPRNIGYTADTPVPYRIDDLVNLVDERMGKLENRSSRMQHYKLLQRIQAFRNHPRYAFMFENANIGGDTMAEVLSQLFRLPHEGKPMTIMQLAGFPAEVVDSVVSVLCRMAFDFGLWSDGAAPLLFVCEEAHRYAPADPRIGFGPTRRALSRIAKEGRKYGVFLGLVTQRPAEIDPTIISQCNTLFVMRMSNDRDQAIIRSAVSDAGASLLTFLPTLGMREVFAFGSGVALPTRMKFKELPVQFRPNSDATGNTRSDVGLKADRGMIDSVVERWRSATMSQKGAIFDDDGFDVTKLDAASLQPTPRPAPPVQPAQPVSLDPNRFRTLKQPLGGAAPGPAAPAAPGQPPRFR